MGHGNDAARFGHAKGTRCGATVPAERAKSLTIAERVALAVAGIAVIARGASGYSQAVWAQVIGTSEDVVKKIESTRSEDHRRALNLKHMIAMPDEALDALLGELARVRELHGFAARQWIAAPEIVHADEAARLRAFVLESTDVQRALATNAPREVVVKEVRELIEASCEVLASRQKAA